MASRFGFRHLVLLGLVVAFSFQGTHGLFMPTEGRYAEVAREMLETGNYLEPTLDHHPHWTKPPLTYWTAAAGMTLLGRNAWGARAFNALAFWLTVLAVATIGARLWDHRTGLFAGLVYATSILPALGAAFLTTDTLLALFETLAVLSYVSAYRSPSPRARRWWVRAMWLAFGVAFFTKGPPALLPLLALFVFHAGASVRCRLFDAAGLLVFFVSSFWWYAVVSANHPGLLTYFIQEEIVNRSVTDEFRRNPQWYAPLVIYVPGLVFGLGAWLPATIIGARRGAREKSGGRGVVFGSADSPNRLLVWWIVLPLVVLSLSKSRLLLYILPLSAPLALLSATLVSRLGARQLVATAAVALLLCVGLKASLDHVHPTGNAKRISDAAREAGAPGARFALVHERRLYGLTFYFDGALERLSINPGEDWARGDIEAAAAQDASGRRPWVFITNPTGTRALAALLERARIPYTHSVAFGHDLVATRPTPPAR